MPPLPQHLLPAVRVRGREQRPAPARGLPWRAAVSDGLCKEERGCHPDQMLQHSPAKVSQARGAQLNKRRHVARARRLHAQHKLDGSRGVSRLPPCSLLLFLVVVLLCLEQGALEQLRVAVPGQHPQALARSRAPDPHLDVAREARAIHLRRTVTLDSPAALAYTIAY